MWSYPSLDAAALIQPFMQLGLRSALAGEVVHLLPDDLIAKAAASNHPWELRVVMRKVVCVYTEDPEARLRPSGRVQLLGAFVVQDGQTEPVLTPLDPHLTPSDYRTAEEAMAFDDGDQLEDLVSRSQYTAQHPPFFYSVDIAASAFAARGRLAEVSARGGGTG